MIQARRPLSLTPLMSATAAARPMVARLPLSRYRNGGASRPFKRARTALATWRPSCIATGATPGRVIGEPSRSRTRTMSPSAKISGWPGSVRSASTVTRPARSSSAPVCSANAEASPEAVTPAAQTTVRVGMRAVAPSGCSIVTAVASTSTTVLSSSGLTPSRRSERSAFADSDGGKPVRTRSAVSTSRTRALRESTARKSRRRVSRASSAIWPAISTPVGPAPTTTNVSHSSRRSGSRSSSAASNAARMPLRTVSALSSDLTSAACALHSSWPKYE